MPHHDQKSIEDLTVYWAQAQPAVSAFISSMVPNFQDAEDILQNVAMVTVQKYAEFDENRSFAAWAIGIARNLVYKYYSERSKERVALDDEALKLIAHVYESDLAKFNDMSQEMKQALRGCVRHLKTKWRQMLELHYIRELNAARIAQRMGLTRNNVFVCLHRIRTALRECVDRRLAEEAP